MFRSRYFCSQLGAVHADDEAEAGEMDVEGRTAGPFDLNHHFLFVQPYQCAYGRMVLSCAA